MRTKVVLSLVVVTSALMGLGTGPQAFGQQYFKFKAERAVELQRLLLDKSNRARLKDPALKDIKVAIFDNGFGSYKDGSDVLPKTARLISDPAVALKRKSTEIPMDPGSVHGLAMAQTLWAITGMDAENAPEIFMVNANMWDNFTAAVDWAIANQIDIVINAHNFEIGNHNGSGFVNKKVDEALDKGILWLNAAGNNGRTMYSGAINSHKKKKTNATEKYLKLPILEADNTVKDLDGLELEVELDSTPITITVSWNDLKNTTTEATNKDIDVELLNADGTIVTTTIKKKVGDKMVDVEVPITVNLRSDAKGDAVKAAGDDREYSLLPREQMVMILNQGTYKIRLLDRSGNFVGKRDRVRVMIDSTREYDARTQSKGFTLLDRTKGMEIFTPGDNPRVVTIGDLSELSSRGPNIDGIAKPDVLVAESRIELSNGENHHQGTSTATALFGGIVAMLLATDDNFETMADLKQYIQNVGVSQGLNMSGDRRVDMPVIRNPEAQQQVQGNGQGQGQGQQGMNQGQGNYQDPRMQQQYPIYRGQQFVPAQGNRWGTQWHQGNYMFHRPNYRR